MNSWICSQPSVLAKRPSLRTNSRPVMHVQWNLYPALSSVLRLSLLEVHKAIEVNSQAHVLGI